MIVMIARQNLKVGNWYKADFGIYGVNILVQITGLDIPIFDGSTTIYNFSGKTIPHIPELNLNCIGYSSLIGRSLEPIDISEEELMWETLKN